MTSEAARINDTTVPFSIEANARMTQAGSVPILGIIPSALHLIGVACEALGGTGCYLGTGGPCYTPDAGEGELSGLAKWRAAGVYHVRSAGRSAATSSANILCCGLFNCCYGQCEQIDRIPDPAGLLRVQHTRNAHLSMEKHSIKVVRQGARFCCSQKPRY